MNRRIRHRKEIVFRISGDIGDVLSAHKVGIHINRVNRVRNQNHIVVGKQLRDVSGIALCTVGDENIGWFNLRTVSCIVFRNCLAQKFISLFRTISLEGLGACHCINTLVKSLDGKASEWKGNISDSETDDVCIRMCLRVSGNTMCNFGEKIAFF